MSGDDQAPPPVLTLEQLRQYEEKGYLVLEGLIPPEAVRELQAEIQRMLSMASDLDKSNAVFDLEESHDAAAGQIRVRRVTRPDKLSEPFRRLMRRPSMLGVAKQILGTGDLRHGNFKLNLKSSEYGAAVQWHQDWAFYPHTNQNLLAAGIMLDDVTTENAPLMFLPGSHKGPLFNHHRDGVFVGGVSDVAEIGLEKLEREAVRITGPAGSVSFHHARLLHGSDLNRSGKSRPMVFLEVNPTDAWPLAPRPGEPGSQPDPVQTQHSKPGLDMDQLTNQPIQFQQQDQRHRDLEQADARHGQPPESRGGRTVDGYPIVNLGDLQLLCGAHQEPRMEYGLPIRMPWPKPVGDRYQGSIYATQNLIQNPWFCTLQEEPLEKVTEALRRGAEDHEAQRPGLGTLPTMEGSNRLPPARL